MIKKFVVKPRHRVMAPLSLLLILIGENAPAQEQVSRRGAVLGAGLGFGRAGIAVSQQSNDQSGIASTRRNR